MIIRRSRLIYWVAGNSFRAGQKTAGFRLFLSAIDRAVGPRFLYGQHLSRLVLEGDRVVAEERLLVDRAQRIREARVGPDGALYVLTNEEGDAPRGTAELLRIFRD